MEKLSSRSNPVIKNFRSLATSARLRREQGLAFLEGQRLCCDAAASGVVLTHLLVTETACKRLGEQQATLTGAATAVWLITDDLADYISQTKSEQGVFALCPIPTTAMPTPSPSGRYLLLDCIQDPGNMGTIIRCAEALGIDCVFCSQDCADLWSPKTLRSTMGSAFRQPALQVPSLCSTIEGLQGVGVQVYAAALDSDAVTPPSLQRSGGLAIVIGNEGNGVSRQVLDRCNGRVYIPMTQRIESLNAATAAAILMWEITGRGGVRHER